MKFCGRSHVKALIMYNITTVTVNPAIDVAATTDRVVPGPKLRCGPSRIDPGGGGINVARTIAKFGGEAKAVIAVGGPTGERLISMVQGDGVTTVAVPAAGQTRQNLAVTDAQTGAQYRFSLASDPWGPQDVDRVIASIKANTKPNGFVVLSGGLAPGMPDGFHGRMQSELDGITDKIIVDTCDPALSELIARPHAPLHVLRLDRNESAIAASRDISGIDEYFEFGASLIARGVAKIVVIGQGAQGSMLVTRNRQIFCHAPDVQVASKIGAGDAFVGAFVLSLARDEPLERALQWGVAAASATVGTEGTALCTLQSAQSLLPHCRVEAFNP